MTILVTGWAWFLGSNLCALLLGKNHEVYCIDNFTTGRLENITLFLGNPQFHLIEHDIRFPLHWDESKKIDQIYNLACPASPPHYQKDPLYTLDTCYIGMKNMLELAKKHDATILQASTSEVYGDPHIHPQIESYRGNVNPIGIRSCYDEGKRVAETLCVDYHRKYNTNIKIIRIFNTYGPHMDPKDGRVVSNFIMQALRNEDITIYGDGNQTRSFQYIDDLLAGMVALMNSPKELTWPVNIGTEYEFTMVQLAQFILRTIPESTSNIIYKPLPSDDPKQRKADNTLAYQVLGWSPQITLEEGLKRTVEYFRLYK